MTLEMDTLIRYLPQSRERKNLKTTRISQDRFLPTAELMQPAEFAHDIKSRAEKKMVGIS
jgi:hypothetical protein